MAEMGSGHGSLAVVDLHLEVRELLSGASELAPGVADLIEPAGVRLGLSELRDRYSRGGDVPIEHVDEQELERPAVRVGDPPAHGPVRRRPCALGLRRVDSDAQHGVGRAVVPQQGVSRVSEQLAALVDTEEPRRGVRAEERPERRHVELEGEPTDPIGRGSGDDLGRRGAHPHLDRRVVHPGRLLVPGEVGDVDDATLEGDLLLVLFHCHAMTSGERWMG
ncbi:hypothetical protein WME88_19835 [Sorangium sp. So ce216]